MLKDVFSPIKLYMIQVINLLTNYLLVELWDIPLLSTPDGNVDESFAQRS